MITWENNRFTDQTSSAGYIYPGDYSVIPINEQILKLAGFFGFDPGPALTFAEILPELPRGAEGYFAVLRWQAIATTYTEGVKNVLKAIGGRRRFRNERKDQFKEGQLRRLPRSEEAFSELYERQKGDIFIVPAQFGMRYREHSFRQVREIFQRQRNEFGLGILETGCMLLTHPIRERCWEQLHVDCPGDEWGSGNGIFVSAPHFYVREDGTLYLSSCWIDEADPRCGSASGFLQS